jgi:hypothetical protein
MRGDFPAVVKMRDVSMDDQAHPNTSISFECAPPVNMQAWLGLTGTDWKSVRLRALLVAGIGWAPLIVLAIAQSLWTRTYTLASLLSELGVHARYLLAAPLLVVAQFLCAPQLGEIIRHLTRSSIVVGDDRRRLAEAGDGMRRLLVSPVAEIVVVLLAYAVALAANLSYTPDQLPAWARPADFMPRYSMAGWWHMLVSLPLLMILILGWVWRLMLWSRLLWTISRMDLRLLVSHPDRCGGLSFVGHSIRATAIVGTALAIIVAGRSAHTILENHTIPTPYLYFNIGLLTTVALLLIAPLLVFVGPLHDAWLRGTLEYGLLADRIGQAFERQWLDANSPPTTGSEPDLSTMSDLCTVVTNVNGMRSIPIDVMDLLVLAVALLLPFLPVVFLAFPLDLIWGQLKGLLV